MEVPPEGIDNIDTARHVVKLVKLSVKDGIMNLNGKDYVFQRAHGDVEW